MSPRLNRGKCKRVVSLKQIVIRRCDHSQTIYVHVAIQHYPLCTYMQTKSSDYISTYECDRLVFFAKYSNVI